MLLHGFGVKTHPSQANRCPGGEEGQDIEPFDVSAACRSEHKTERIKVAVTKSQFNLHSSTVPSGDSLWAEQFGRPVCRDEPRLGLLFAKHLGLRVSARAVGVTMGRRLFHQMEVASVWRPRCHLNASKRFWFAPGVDAATKRGNRELAATNSTHRRRRKEQRCVSDDIQERS